MEFQDSVIIKWQRLLVEAFTIWIMIYAQQIIFDYKPNTYGFFIWIASSIIFYFLLKGLLKQKLKLVHFLGMTPFLFMVAWSTGFSPLLSVALSGFLVWRMIRHEDDPYLESETYFMGISVVFVFVGHLWGVYQYHENANGIVIMLIIQTTILLFGKMLYYFMMEEESTNKFSTKKALTLFSISFITFGSAGLLLLIFPLIRSIYYQVVNGVIGGFIFLIKPLFDYLEGLIAKNEEKLEDAAGHLLGQQEQEESVKNQPTEQVITSEHLLIGFIIIVSIIILIILIKNRDKLMEGVKQKVSSEQAFYTKSNRVEGKKLWKRKKHRQAPNNEVRKAFYKLEVWSAKKGLGRYVDESINEWLKRYNLNQVIDEEAIEVYRDVRYGDYEPEPVKKEKYLDQINMLKEEFKKKLK